MSFYPLCIPIPENSRGHEWFTVSKCFRKKGIREAFRSLDHSFVLLPLPIGRVITDTKPAYLVVGNQSCPRVFLGFREHCKPVGSTTVGASVVR